MNPLGFSPRTRIASVLSAFVVAGMFLLIPLPFAMAQESPLVRGNNAVDKGDYDLAITCFTEAIQLDPKSEAAYYNRGNAYAAKVEYEKALADYAQAITLDPQDAEAFANRGSVYENMNDYSHAVENYSQALRINSKLGHSYNDRGYCYEALGQYDKALADFKQALQFEPGFARDYSDLAWLLATCPKATIRDGKKATEAATKACDLTEWKDPNMEDTLAAACAEAGDFDSAVKWEKKSLEAPDQPASAISDFKSRLALYQAHRAYHETK